MVKTYMCKMRCGDISMHLWLDSANGATPLLPVVSYSDYMHIVFNQQRKRRREEREKERKSRRRRRSDGSSSGSDDDRSYRSATRRKGANSWFVHTCVGINVAVNMKAFFAKIMTWVSRS